MMKTWSDAVTAVRVSLVLLLGPVSFAIAQQVPAPAPAAAPEGERLRWEVVTDGTTSAAADSADSTTPALTGSDANFLVRFNHEIALPTTPGAPGSARNAHLAFETGFTTLARAVTVKADTSSSEAVAALVRQGATVTPSTESGISLSSQRAFTVGAQFDANRLVRANGSGAYMEIGGVVRGNVDAFVDDQRFFEKDGLTYVLVPGGLGTDSAFFRGELGFRLRVTQPEEGTGNSAFRGDRADGTRRNLEDFLFLEVLFQRNDAVKGLSVSTEGSTGNRFVLRFLATPEIVREGKHTKFLIGMEVSNDLSGLGSQEVKVFYGTNLNLRRLFD